MIKVLHVRCSGNLLGAENVILQLCSVESNEVRSIVGVIQDSRDPYPLLASAAEKKGLPVKVFHASQLLDQECIKSIAKYVEDNAIDIIHTHGYREDIYLLLARTGRPLIATNHLWKRTNPRLRLYALLDSIALSFFDHIVAVSSPILKEMKKLPHLHWKNMRIIPNGIDVSAFQHIRSRQFIEHLSIPPSSTVLVTVSSLTVEKGHIYLLKALADESLIQRDWFLLIIGDGPQRKGLEEIALELKIDKKIFFLGRREDIPNMLLSADVFVMPSLSEGLPMALLEAMAAGLPCVASRVGDIPLLISPVRPDLLVSPKDIKSLTDKITYLLDDETSRLKIGAQMKKAVIENFSATAMAKKYFDLYREIGPSAS